MDAQDIFGDAPEGLEVRGCEERFAAVEYKSPVRQWLH
jgi:hypothetical protein